MLPRVAQEFGPQAGPSLLPTRAQRARSPSHAVTDGRVPLVRPSFPLSLRDADGETPPVSSFFFTCGGTATAPAAVGGFSARARVRIGLASSSRLR